MNGRDLAASMPRRTRLIVEVSELYLWVICSATLMTRRFPSLRQRKRRQWLRGAGLKCRRVSEVLQASCSDSTKVTPPPPRSCLAPSRPGYMDCRYRSVPRSRQMLSSLETGLMQEADMERVHMMRLRIGSECRLCIQLEVFTISACSPIRDSHESPYVHVARDRWSSQTVRASQRHTASASAIASAGKIACSVELARMPVDVHGQCCMVTRSAL